MVDRRCNELGSVDHRTTTNGEQKVELFLTYLRNGEHQCFVGRVWLDATKFLYDSIAKCSLNFIQSPVFLGAGATVKDQYASCCWHEVCQLGDGVCAKNDSCRVVEFKIQHFFLLK